MINERKGPEPETKIYIMTITYGKFISDPQEIFSSLLKGLMSMYHHCLQKYTLSELDVGELNLLNILILRFLKSWQSILPFIVIGIIFIVLYAILKNWFSTLS